MEFLFVLFLSICIVFGGIYGIGKLFQKATDTPEKKALREEVKREFGQKGYGLTYLGGHPELEENIFYKLIINSNQVGIYCNNDFYKFKEQINITKIKYCGVRTSQQIKTMLALARC